MNAPPRNMSAPAAFIARAASSSDSRLSITHGPPMTTGRPPPIRTPPTLTTVGACGRPSRLASMYGRCFSRTALTPGRPATDNRARDADHGAAVPVVEGARLTSRGGRRGQDGVDSRYRRSGGQCDDHRLPLIAGPPFRVGDRGQQKTEAYASVPRRCVLVFWDVSGSSPPVPPAAPGERSQKRRSRTSGRQPARGRGWS